MNKFIITRTGGNQFAVETSVLLSDGSVQADRNTRLVGNVLRSHEQKGCIRIGGLMRLNLGPVSFAKVTALLVGQSVTL